VAVLAFLLSTSCGGATTSPPSSAGPPVTVVMTTHDQTSLLAPQPQMNFSAVASGSEHVIVVDEAQKHQQIEGFGAAFTDSAAYLLNEVATPSARSEAMNRLFTRDGGGIGLSFMRTVIGSSDMARSQYSYDDMPPGQTDPTLAHFSIAHDRADIIPIILQTKNLNPQMRLVASMWSAPGWMKTTDSLIGGSLLPSAYRPYADYFVRFLEAYSAAGVTVDYLTHENEPEFTPADYPGMKVDAATQTLLLRDYILPALQANDLSAKILVYDHNWDDTTFPATVLADDTISKSDRVAGVAWHWYAGPPGAMTTLHNAFPMKGNYVTEASGGAFIPDELKTDFEQITQSMRNWSKSFVKWTLALDENHGPHVGGCGVCTPLVIVNSGDGSVSNAIEYFTLGQFSRYVLPGAVRIYSSNTAGVVSAAFVNPDNSKVLVAFNDTVASETFQVLWGRQSFTYTLPALSAATFTWVGAQAGSYTIQASSQIQASSYNEVSGLQTENTADVGGGYDLGYSNNNSSAVYKSVAFPESISGIEARVASNSNGGTLEFHLDSADGPSIGSIVIPNTGGWQTWATVFGGSTGASGIHDLYIVFKGFGPIGNLNWFQFH
jgi:glucosylceramidase